ncbi:hypothetical protein ACQUFY_18530 [Robbsia andropogonis]
MLAIMPHLSLHIDATPSPVFVPGASPTNTLLPGTAFAERKQRRLPLSLAQADTMFKLSIMLLAAAAITFSTPIYAKNKPGDCLYFADFLVTLSAMRDAGKPQAETVAYAREKATKDRLAKSVVDLFGGEAIGMYYTKRQYAGTAQQVHDLAYKNCINSTLP